MNKIHTTTEQTMTDQTVAKTILAQLGGNKFIAMTGAHNLVAAPDALTLKFKGCRKTNCIRITLTPADTYDVEFFQIRGADFKQVEKVEGAYAQMLPGIFENATGLATSL